LSWALSLLLAAWLLALSLSSTAAISFLAWSNARSLSSTAIRVAALLLYTLSLWAALLSAITLVCLLAAAAHCTKSNSSDQQNLFHTT